MDQIATLLFDEISRRGKSKRLKIRTLLSQFGFKKRSEDNTTLITEILNEKGILITPSIMRLGNRWEQNINDWVYLSEIDQNIRKNIKNDKILLPEDWNNDGWFDALQNREFRTEKEVETKFILPLLNKLGYSENDRFDNMPVAAAHGSRKTTLEIDFAMFDEDLEELDNQVLLVVEAKKEYRLIKKAELEKAQRQTKSYSIWLGCHFGLVTDSRTVQVLDLMPHFGCMKVLFECERADLKDNFKDLFKIISKPSLSSYYMNLIT